MHLSARLYRPACIERDEYLSVFIDPPGEEEDPGIASGRVNCCAGVDVVVGRKNLFSVADAAAATERLDDRHRVCVLGVRFLGVEDSL